MSEWDFETDFLILGSGAGGMASALAAHDAGMSALVLEKTAQYGGTTAQSGGVVWIPNNHQMPKHAIKDSEQDAWDYLSRVTKGAVDEKRLRAYIRYAPEMIKRFEDVSEVKFDALPKYIDYYPELPGGKPGGRSMEPLPVSLKCLGDIWHQQRLTLAPKILGRVSITAKESQHIMNLGLPIYAIIAKRLLAYYMDIPARIKKLPDVRQTLGCALTVRLRHSLLKRDIPLWLNAKVEELLVDGLRVVGAAVSYQNKVLRIRAAKGVMLAAGGFGHNAQLREKFHPQSTGNAWTSESDGNVGDAITLGQALGAQLEFMQCAWWTPSYMLPSGLPIPLVIGKSLPGSIFVNKKGRRFTNEAAPYEDVVKAQYLSHARGDGCVPCHMVFDARFRRSYPAGPIMPSRMQPDNAIPAEFKNANFLKRGETIEELAEKIGVDAANLVDEINKNNRYAASGKDLDFGRGNSSHDHYYSDKKIKPNPNIAPIIEPPFYSFEIYPGDLGTKGGLKADEFGRVLNTKNEPIAGLYVTGNNSAAVMGDSYPGAGSTIGPAMTFGYIAARHAANIYSSH